MAEKLHLVASLSALLLAGCETPNEAQDRYRREEWVEPCRDKAMLLATTAGSPSGAECPNRLHRMSAEVATHSSNEEAAALVWCRCVERLERGEVDGGGK